MQPWILIGKQQAAVNVVASSEVCHLDDIVIVATAGKLQSVVKIPSSDSVIEHGWLAMASSRATSVNMFAYSFLDQFQG